MQQLGTDAFLRIESVVKDFGDFRAVDNVSLEVARGVRSGAMPSMARGRVMF